jgi:hypothetical protein
MISEKTTGRQFSFLELVAFAAVAMYAGVSSSLVSSSLTQRGQRCGTTRILAPTRPC